MAHRRHWQARVTYPGGGTMILGLKAGSLPTAIRKSLELAAVPGIAEHLTVTRLYSCPCPQCRAARRNGSQTI